MAKMKVKQQ